ncbi:MAG: tRNA (guanosine(46)-N7)-methyltransferase TrmB [Clostridiales bacterium]|nr:tRNA (guanosine(46)-N7)-methyltransferase TrmB [Clostridiales bacterium]MCD7828795.1 tRNA (guanosine(46)-N7)-methyltransferase TrmB [Clostridiales bacterium]
MRKKKNLEEKIKSVSGNLTVLYSEDRNFTTAVEKKEYIDFSEIFGNDNPLELEVGCGKGQFICELAKRNPDINYIAVEVNPNVIYMACKKAADAGLSNVHFLQCRAEYLPKYIPDKAVEMVYLNFSCPFPKKKYACHRLTNERFLKIYKQLLKPNGEIHQKTDNMHFFEYSIEQLSKEGFAMKNVSLDLHNSGFENNIMTEYESRFVSLGQPIYRLEAYVRAAE